MINFGNATMGAKIINMASDLGKDESFCQILNTDTDNTGSERINFAVAK